jgi:sugar lactone lactonase YvrE
MHEITALPTPPALLGESPFWHPQEQCLYWCDIPGHALHRYRPDIGQHTRWALDSEPGCCAPLLGGGLLLALRSGLWHFDTDQGDQTPLAEPPYDPAKERFNDGRADPQGRFWVGTLYDPRTPPLAALYRYGRTPGGVEAEFKRMAGDITVSNGLAFSPDGRTLYWSDTTSHRIFALDFDGSDGSVSRQRVLAQFPPKQTGQPLDTYGGRPDGAAVDVEGAYWVAMFEGQRLLRLSPEGQVLQEVRLPVRCPTMPCLGGADLRTLYITTARHKRPDDELAAQPLAGHVLSLRVPVPGLPVHLAHP